MDYITSIIPALFSGLKYTLFIFSVTLVFSIPFGFIVSMGRLSNIKLISNFFKGYIYIIRGTPLLLQIIFIYYGLPEIGLVFNRILAVLIAFILNYSAYFGEIFRGGINSIDKGQYEACSVIGIPKSKTFIYIILPQVIKRTISATINEIVTLVKDTSLVYVVGIGELLRAAKIASNRDASLIPFIITGVIYLLLTSIFTLILDRFERRYNYYE